MDTLSTQPLKTPAEHLRDAAERVCGSVWLDRETGEERAVVRITDDCAFLATDDGEEYSILAWARRFTRIGDRPEGARVSRFFERGWVDSRSVTGGFVLVRELGGSGGMRNEGRRMW